MPETSGGSRAHFWAWLFCAREIILQKSQNKFAHIPEMSIFDSETHPNRVFLSTKRFNMTKEQALTALADLVATKHIRKQSLAYQTALAAIENPGEPQICGKHQGSGRFAGSKSWQWQTSQALTKAGIPHTCANVAPKGGRAGNRITVILTN